MPTIRILTLVELDDAAAIPDFPVARRLSPAEMTTFSGFAGTAFAAIVTTITTITCLVLQNGTRALDVSFNNGGAFITLPPNGVLQAIDASLVGIQLVVRDSAQASPAPFKALLAGA